MVTFCDSARLELAGAGRPLVIKLGQLGGLAFVFQRAAQILVGLYETRSARVTGVGSHASRFLYREGVS
jgi:hypothetical protein